VNVLCVMVIPPFGPNLELARFSPSPYLPVVLAPLGWCGVCYPFLDFFNSSFFLYARATGSPFHIDVLLLFRSFRVHLLVSARPVVAPPIRLLLSLSRWRPNDLNSFFFSPPAPIHAFSSFYCAPPLGLRQLPPLRAQTISFCPTSSY